jgi:alpha-ribazole phosphatase/probable phosphoglycerate mutase
MKTTTIDLLRHGDVAGGVRLLGQCDDPLSELGWAQMRSLLHSKSPPWETIITSPLQRCSAFASELAKRYSLRLVEDPRLKEIGLGRWEGQLISDLFAKEGGRMQRFRSHPMGAQAPGGESYQAFEERIFKAWDVLLETYAGAHCLLIAHGGSIRVILRRILNFPVERLFQIEVPHICLSRIQKDEGIPARLVFHGGGLWI